MKKRSTDLIIGIIGEGKIGSDLFFYLNTFSFQLVWICSKDADKEKLINTFKKKTKRCLKSGIIDQEAFEKKIKTTIISDDCLHLSNCDIIIEAIFEDEKEKIELFSTIDRIIQKKCVLATNTSSIPLMELTQAISQKDRFIGLHFFYPVSFKNIVEINTTPDTSRDTIDTIKKFLIMINRFSVIFPGKANFILNRLFLDFQSEACLILDENILTIKEIDRLVKETLFPIGVFEFFDHVGNDVMLTSVINYTRNSDIPEFYEPLKNILQDKVAANKLGIKTKSGFYDYSNVENREKQNPHPDINREDYKKKVIKRLTNSYLNSAKDIINKGYCSSQDIEYAVKEYMGCDEGPVSMIERSEVTF